MNEKHVIEIMEAFSASGLAELDLALGEAHLALRRYQSPGLPSQAAHPAAPAQAAPSAPSHEAQVAASGLAHQSAAPGREESPSGKSQAEQGLELIVSPIVATFYRSPGPDAPALAEVGARVKAGQNLCILEAMKVMNELPAEFDCEIVRILPDNASMVEYGQALFEVRRI